VPITAAQKSLKGTSLVLSLVDLGALFAYDSISESGGRVESPVPCARAKPISGGAFCWLFLAVALA
jgi:hypothetical protein